MADEPKKDGKREAARKMYDNPRSRKDDAAEEKSEPASEKKAEETAGEEEKADSEPASEAKAEEGGEPVREPGEAKAKPAGNPMIGGHKAQRVALHLRHEKERLDLHGDQRTEHKVMTDAHEKEMAEVHRA